MSPLTTDIDASPTAEDEAAAAAAAAIPAPKFETATVAAAAAAPSTTDATPPNLAAAAAAVIAAAAPAPRPRPTPFTLPPPTPAPYGGNVLEGHIAELLRLADGASNSGPAAAWKSTGTTSGVSCWVPTDAVPGCKGTGIIPFPRRAVWRALTDMEFKGATDAQFDGAAEVARLNEHDVIVHWAFRGKMGVQGRDYVNFNHWRVRRGDGVLIHVAWSVTHPSAPAAGTGTGRTGAPCVRAKCIIGGWVIKPLPGVAAVRAKRAAAAAASTRTAGGATGGDSAAAAMPPEEEDPAIDAEGVEATYLMRSDFAGELCRSHICTVVCVPRAQRLCM